MKYIKSKNNKMKRIMLQIKEENLVHVVERFLRFTYDQHSFTWLCWRKKFFDMDLTKEEIGLFNLKLCFKKAKGYKLRTKDPDIENDPGTINYDPDLLGVKFGAVDFLLPCLDPDLPETQRKDPSKMSTRFLHGKFELSYLEDIDASLDPIEILMEYPVYLHFYPA